MITATAKQTIRATEDSAVHLLIGVGGRREEKRCRSANCLTQFAVSVTQFAEQCRRKFCTCHVVTDHWHASYTAEFSKRTCCSKISASVG